MSELSFLISKLIISLKMSSTLLVRAGKCLRLFVQFEAFPELDHNAASVL